MRLHRSLFRPNRSRTKRSPSRSFRCRYWSRFRWLRCPPRGRYSLRCRRSCRTSSSAGPDCWRCPNIFPDSSSMTRKWMGLSRSERKPCQCSPAWRLPQPIRCASSMHLCSGGNDRLTKMLTSSSRLAKDKAVNPVKFAVWLGSIGDHCSFLFQIFDPIGCMLVN
jgi:hypothetical protein